MRLDISTAQQLVDYPSEKLNTELKRWIYPDHPAGMAKNVRAVLGLHDRDGGHLIIGSDDKTHLPDLPNRDFVPQELFHGDIIHSLVSKYSSQQFEISVAYPNRKWNVLVVVAIPSGVRVPVAAKKDLVGPDKKRLIREGDVYFRTWQSNNTVRTATARPDDWADTIEICMENRKADLGRFVRRHLTPLPLHKPPHPGRHTTPAARITHSTLGPDDHRRHNCAPAICARPRLRFAVPTLI
ncbi:MAG TPA: hypothetical protein VGH36_14570 [Acetobacteraceae bacterium]|jgi:hypothetical protein